MKVEIMKSGEYNSSGATTFTGKIKLKSGESVACKARRQELEAKISAVMEDLQGYK